MCEFNNVYCRLQMARQRLQAGLARVARLPHSLLHDQLTVSVRAHRVAAAVS